ncbi:Hypothetical predicted protein [Lecanosticta acicola]|uniref:A-kinase anchor protein 7-like phosphoesterase domain-containing protein n=1 Tax=Lecanosticta acicola TaxID=111012 RepID=A0AAI9EA64_9PEZI|nr:Hypothetical predicted protein [Lecanosticta acicola]
MARYNNGSKRPPGPKKPPLTHFLCVPLVSEASRPHLEQSLQRFQTEASVQGDSDNQRGAVSGTTIANETNEYATPHIHPKAFRPVGALHCTLGVMSLKSEKLAEAVTFLESLDVSALLKDACTSQAPTEAVALETAHEPLVVNLIGLESMHPPQKTSILYSAPSDPTGRLYTFCLAVQKEFSQKGFLVEDDRELKLHATIVNTIYAKGKKRPMKRTPTSTPTASASTSLGADKTGGHADGSLETTGRSQGHGPDADAPLKMDARALLERYKDHVWAPAFTLTKLAICEMGAKKVTDAQGNVVGEQYTEVASVALPTVPTG